MANLTDSEREQAIKRTAFRIVGVLDGITLCDAAAAIDLARNLIATTHAVDGSNSALMAFQREFESAVLR